MNLVEKIQDQLNEIELIEIRLKQAKECLKVLCSNDINTTDLNNVTYESLKDMFSKTQWYFDDQVKTLISSTIDTKKKEKFPDLLKPNYYPEINDLNISDEEKLRLDKATRESIRYHMYEDNLNKHKLTKDDLENLVSIGIAEKNFDFRCRKCGFNSEVISYNDLIKFKRIWELEAKYDLSDDEKDELDILYKQHCYGVISLYCMDCDDFFVEISNQKQLDDYMNNARVFYKIIKQPDLTYEKL